MGLRWRLLPSVCGSLNIDVHRFPAGRSWCRRSALGAAESGGGDFDSFVGFRNVGHEQFHPIDRVHANLAGEASDPLANLIGRGQLAPGAARRIRDLHRRAMSPSNQTACDGESDDVGQPSRD